MASTIDSFTYQCPDVFNLGATTQESRIIFVLLNVANIISTNFTYIIIFIFIFQVILHSFQSLHFNHHLHLIISRIFFIFIHKSALYLWNFKLWNFHEYQNISHIQAKNLKNEIEIWIETLKTSLLFAITTVILRQGNQWMLLGSYNFVHDIIWNCRMVGSSAIKPVSYQAFLVRRLGRHSVRLKQNVKGRMILILGSTAV